MPAFTPWPRAILHVDMDAFYASVEQRDRPELRGKPLVVGGAPEERGIVAAASYEARPFGIRSAMPMARALRLCPHLIRIPGDMEKYHVESERIQAVFSRVTPIWEAIGLDEAFLDVTGCQLLHGEPVAMARWIKKTVRAETRLVASVGVAANRLCAKIASDLDKPDGLAVIAPGTEAARLAPLAVAKLWGVGRVTGEKLAALGVRTIGDLQRWPAATLRSHFGAAAGDSLHAMAHGADDSPVDADAPEKSVSHEHTFARDVVDVTELERVLLWQADEVMRRCRARGLAGRTVTLKVRYGDFTSVTRRRTFAGGLATAAELHAAAVALLRDHTEAGRRPVRLVGTGLSSLADADERQGDLFSALPAADGSAAPAPSTARRESVERAVERIRKKFGPDSLGRASLSLGGALSRPMRHPDALPPPTRRAAEGAEPAP